MVNPCKAVSDPDLSLFLEISRLANINGVALRSIALPGVIIPSKKNFPPKRRSLNACFISKAISLGCKLFYLAARDRRIDKKVIWSKSWSFLKYIFCNIFIVEVKLRY